MTATRRRLMAGVAAIFVVLMVASSAFLVRQTFFAPSTIYAYFSSATAIYPGDQVRVLGVEVGTISSIESEGTQAKIAMSVDRGVPIPADARAIIVAPNLVAARYIQLAPAYDSDGPTMPDGGVIPQDRTAIPVEWDEVKEQLARISEDLGPTSPDDQTSVARFIDSAANAMDGNGAKLRETLAQLSAAGRIFAEGSGDLVDIVTNLQRFVSALRDSNIQIVQFQNRFAALSSVVNDSRSDLDTALTTLSGAIDDARRFIAGSRAQTSEQVERLADLTKVLVEQRKSVENILHAAPTALANTYNMYNPDAGTFVGSFVFQNFSNPVQFLCSGIGAVENATAPETARLCAEYLGPALRLANFNYLPIPFNPLLSAVAQPQNLVYSDPRLAPGGGGTPPGLPEVPPAVSAYTGSGDVPPPPGYGPPPGPPPAPPATVDTLILPHSEPAGAAEVPLPPTSSTAPGAPTP
ncbi:MCE family protein [Mycolicibacterium sp. BiH015]|uniref:MCE family protein n=1 Tax=Mycolicibacterium sp. BiH015 TaxID=3018808 RepID=UPI0022E592AA|nr:MCE family protein [Mycolicibacterium sp. BiH015]MDA2894902.1 MCE family protein [Mycolicibacterium sp. BiH015]